RPATNHRRAGGEAGTVIEQVGDLFGRTVNQAARICGVAGPGEVIVGQGAAVILDGETRCNSSRWAASTREGSKLLYPAPGDPKCREQRRLVGRILSCTQEREAVAHSAQVGGPDSDCFLPGRRSRTARLEWL